MIALAFHDASKDTAASANGKAYDDLIQIVTRSSLVHVETAFIDGDLTRANCFSAVPEPGCRFATIDLTAPQWLVVEVSWDPVKAMTAARSMDGLKYDMEAILAWFIPGYPHDPNERFCSESGVDIGKACGDARLLNAIAWHTSPAALHGLVA
ncbi:MAG: hypothetical protein KGL39_20420 [Patescibacteria group bacterium]|nr:hypothetical protein [Patescibacteria group bacterium]